MRIEQKDHHWQRVGSQFGNRSFTIFTKDEHCRRGEYAEELDVFAGSVGEAKKIAQFVLDRDYIPGLRIARVELNY